ncbi:MAG: thioredoxin domain-containing protein [Pseudonocardiaceae bacterium]|nr:thioredoxin domain-containing protein [Pseudonocardiaceae bacterium]
MGGAERAERKRRQQEAAARRQQPQAASQRQDGGGRRVVTAVAAVVVVLLAVVVGVGVWLQQRDTPEEPPDAIPVTPPAAGYAVESQGGAIVAGERGAPVTIDVYEDFLCPGCAELEDRDGDRLAQAAAGGQARVRYHPIALLDEESEPPGYSTLAAGASHCAAAAGIFPTLHTSLFAEQPTQGEPGWTRPQIVALGRQLGAGDGFARCVRGDAVEQQVTVATQQARQRIAALRGDGLVGTPTVLVDGKLADPGDSEWLDRALGTAER